MGGYTLKYVDAVLSSYVPEQSVGYPVDSVMHSTYSNAPVSVALIRIENSNKERKRLTSRKTALRMDY